MEFDPHTLHQILKRIEQQMRCPQCGQRVPVDFPSVRMTGDDFVLLQVKCGTCQAFIVLHASLRGLREFHKDENGMNASSTLCLRETDVEHLRDTLSKSQGSFEKLFEEKPRAQKQKKDSRRTDIA